MEMIQIGFLCTITTTIPKNDVMSTAAPSLLLWWPFLSSIAWAIDAILYLIYDYENGPCGDLFFIVCCGDQQHYHKNSFDGGNNPNERE